MISYASTHIPVDEIVNKKIRLMSNNREYLYSPDCSVMIGKDNNVRYGL